MVRFLKGFGFGVLAILSLILGMGIWLALSEYIGKLIDSVGIGFGIATMILFGILFGISNI